MPFFLRVVVTRGKSTLYDGIEQVPEDNNAVQLLDKSEALHAAVAANKLHLDTASIPSIPISQQIRQQVVTVHLSQEEKPETTKWTSINDDVNLTAMITMFSYKLIRYELQPPPPRATTADPHKNAFAMLMEGGKKATAEEDGNLPTLSRSDDGTEPTGEKLLNNHVITSLRDHGIKFKSKSTAGEVVRTLTGNIYILLDASVDTVAAREAGIKRVLGSLGIGYVKEKSKWVRRSTYDDAATSHKVKERYRRAYVLTLQYYNYS
jgi:hypothetical protein